MLCFIICGLVDDGKLMLIGCLLYDSKMIFEDQFVVLESDSKCVGMQGQEIDFVLLVDGLVVECEQGIIIDVVYCFFVIEKCKFIVVDIFGYEQYMCNMVMGVLIVDLVVILIDVCKGVLIQMCCYSYLVQLIGICYIVLVVNKMDLVDYDQVKFDQIVVEYCEFVISIGIQDFIVILIFGFKGDNIIVYSENMLWYIGMVLLLYLEVVEVDVIIDQVKLFWMLV